MEATSSHPGVSEASSSRSSMLTRTSNLSQAKLFPCEAFLCSGGEGKVCSFCLGRWEQKPLGTLPCTAVPSSVKAPQRMSACIWSCGWLSSSAIRLTCSWCFGNEFVSMFTAGRWVINPSWRTDFRAGNDCSGLPFTQPLWSIEFFSSARLLLSCNCACFIPGTCRPDFS